MFVESISVVIGLCDKCFVQIKEAIIIRVNGVSLFVILVIIHEITSHAGASSAVYINCSRNVPFVNCTKFMMQSTAKKYKRFIDKYYVILNSKCELNCFLNKQILLR